MDDGTSQIHDHWMKLANEASDEIDRLSGQIETVKNMIRALRRTPSQGKGLGAVQRAMDLEVNAVLDAILAGWPADTGVRKSPNACAQVSGVG
jgi:hypothetical protein